MSGNKLIFLRISIMLLAALMAQPVMAASSDIIDINTIGIKDVKFDIVEFLPRDIYRESTAQGSVYYPFGQPLYYDGKEQGRVKSLDVYNNQSVKKGEVLAEVVYENMEIEADLEKIRISVNNDEDNVQRESENRRNTIAQMESELDNILRGRAGNNIESLAKTQRLKIDKARCELDYYLYTMQNKIDAQQKEIVKLVEMLGGYQLTAPYDGNVVYIASYYSGQIIQPGTMLMAIYQKDIYRLKITADQTAFRYNNDVTIEIANDSTYRGKVISDPSAVEGVSGQLVYIVRFEDEPNDFDRLSGRRFSVRGSAYELWDVPSISYKAIKNEDAKRYVLIMENNIIKKRYIQMALNNYEYVEILDGLKPGDRILE